MKTAVTLRRSRLPRTASPKARAARSKGGGLRIRNVLVAVDFSAPSLEAIRFALPLLKQFGAALHLIHVCEPDYPLSSLAAMPLIVPELEVGTRVRRHLKDVAKQHGMELRRENIHVLRGRPFEEICRLARDRAIDVIVVATRGNTGLKHLTLGSTAERVVRYSPCPVLVVRGGDRKTAGRKGKAPPVRAIRKILVPIDFSDCSRKGLNYARELARQFKARLILLNSVAVQYYLTSDEYTRYDYPLLMEEAEKASREHMRDLVKKTDWKGIKVEPSLQAGHAGQQICARAKDQGVDLIVTSTHGATGFKHILLGSTAEYVVRHAPCPVLVVPSHERPVLGSPARRK